MRTSIFLNIILCGASSCLANETFHRSKNFKLHSKLKVIVNKLGLPALRTFTERKTPLYNVIPVRIAIEKFITYIRNYRFRIACIQIPRNGSIFQMLFLVIRTSAMRQDFNRNGNDSKAIFFSWISCKTMCEFVTWDRIRISSRFAKKFLCVTEIKSIGCLRPFPSTVNHIYTTLLCHVTVSSSIRNKKWVSADLHVDKR